MKKPKDELCFGEGSGWVKVSETMIDLLKLTREIGHTFTIGKVESIELCSELNEPTRAHFTACF